MRSVNAAIRAAERDAQRRHKQAVKEQISNDAAEAVTGWKEYTDNLVSVHTNLAESINWTSILNQPRPIEPKLNTHHLDAAQEQIKNYKPGFFDFLRGGQTRIVRRLNEALKEAPEQDRLDFETAHYEYLNALEEWEVDRNLADRLLAGDANAIKEVISELQSLSDEALIGSAISFVIEDNFIHAKPEVHSDEIIPSFRRKQLASGRLSETKMPAGQFNELYQDYVCSVALKIGGDLFQILPLEEVYVTCQTHMLNTKTGYKELTPILSVQFVRPTFLSLNLSQIDPSDSLGNFNHVINFKKTKGFAAITPLKAD
ncbi:MAG TPA: hypothetical protein DIT40_11790 [Alphaproteobacteria bacterium]|nr:hypothetical protein [Alphaproteobacteria bacterium]HBC52735.1 hypothetical protein [Alphaproteobacteria bacterium]HCO91644.1 hypothetical protein [Alphaproteobacteria bacterium]